MTGDCAFSTLDPVDQQQAQALRKNMSKRLGFLALAAAGISVGVAIGPSLFAVLASGLKHLRYLVELEAWLTGHWVQPSILVALFLLLVVHHLRSLAVLTVLAKKGSNTAAEMAIARRLYTDCVKHERRLFWCAVSLCLLSGVARLATLVGGHPYRLADGPTIQFALIAVGLSALYVSPIGSWLFLPSGFAKSAPDFTKYSKKIIEDKLANSLWSTSSPFGFSDFVTLHWGFISLRFTRASRESRERHWRGE